MIRNIVISTPGAALKKCNFSWSDPSITIAIFYRKGLIYQNKIISLVPCKASSILRAVKNTFKNIYKQILFRLSAHNSLLFKIFYRYFYRPRKNSISAFLDIYSRQSAQITVVQIGANDGITHDPIHKFIKRDHWQGVLLEPQKEVFDTYLSKIYARDRGIHTLNAALGHSNGTASIYKIGFSHARWATGLTSFRSDVLEKAFTSGHVARQAEKEGVPIPKDPAKQIIRDTVTVISVEQLLEKYDIDKIDLLQIDAEGFDFEIIKMFDLANNAPQIVIYENIHLSDENKVACKDHLTGHGFTVKDFAENTLAMQNPPVHLSSYFND